MKKYAIINRGVKTPLPHTVYVVVEVLDDGSHKTVTTFDELSDDYAYTNATEEVRRLEKLK